MNTLNGQIVWDVDYISIKLFKKSKTPPVQAKHTLKIQARVEPGNVNF